MSADQAAVDRIRAEERVRIAQYLHDSAMQKLALLQLTLGRMRREGSERFDLNITECEEIVAEIGRQMHYVENGRFS